jgi:hypothetical protein
MPALSAMFALFALFALFAFLYSCIPFFSIPALKKKGDPVSRKSPFEFCMKV